MKKILIMAMVFILSAPMLACAGSRSITFLWNQELSADFAGWKLYKATAPGVAVTPANLFSTIAYGGVAQTEYSSGQTLTSPDGQEITYYFVLTAFDTEANESGPSNEVSLKVDFKSPGVPVQFKVKVTGP